MVVEDSVNNTSQLFESIGRTVVNFQQIEQWLSEIIALLLRMKEKDDQMVVAAAMSFGQKVDLLAELYDKRKTSKLQDVDMKAVVKALSTAEEYRNRVIHSFWAIDCSDEMRWVRVKGSLRQRKGLKVSSVAESINVLNDCNDSLLVIREWMLVETSKLQEATKIIQTYMQGTSNQT